jgi:hypothetical protein
MERERYTRSQGHRTAPLFPSIHPLACANVIPPCPLAAAFPQHGRKAEDRPAYAG